MYKYSLQFRPKKPGECQCSFRFVIGQPVLHNVHQFGDFYVNNNSNSSVTVAEHMAESAIRLFVFIFVKVLLKIVEQHRLLSMPGDKFEWTSFKLVAYNDEIKLYNMLRIFIWDEFYQQ